MTSETRDQLIALGFDIDGVSSDQLLGSVLMRSVGDDHLWSWPYRTGVVLENVFHFVLTFEPGEPVYTLLNVNTDWLWLSGAHATPVRTVKLNAEACDECVSAVAKAMSEHSVRVWLWFGDWWVAFRQEHSTLHAPTVQPQPQHHDHDHG